MHRVNLETLLHGGKSKVACETLANGRCEDDGGVHHRVANDQNESIKGFVNPKPRAGADRFSAAGKPPIIGLPATIQTASYAGRGGRRPARVQIFPRKGRGGRKSEVLEPGSPKVSCFGEVLSDRERGRRGREQQRGPAKEPEVKGCWAGLAGILRCAHGSTEREEGEVMAARYLHRSEQSNPAKSASKAAWEVKPPAEAVLGLGGMTRYTSGRRAASWGVEAELGAINPDLESRRR